MKKANVNFLINTIMFLCMSAIVGIGFLLKYKLISGQDRWAIYGRPIELYWLGLDRHQWGYIHLVLGFVLIGLLLVHLVLHWTLIKSVYQRIISLKTARKSIVLAFVSLSFFLIFSPFVIKADVFEKGSHVEHGNQKGERYKQFNKEQDSDIEIEVVQDRRNLFLDKTEVLEETKKELSRLKQNIDVKGFMTLSLVSDTYDIPIDLLKEKLGITATNVEHQKIGQLKKKYDFNISEIKDVITNYKLKMNP